MGTVTININSDDKLNLSSSGESNSSNTQTSSDNSSDGGAPGLDSGSNQAAAASGQIDIGGPPQWLREALSKEGKALSSVSASGDLHAMEGGDAGAAKVTLN